MPIPKMYPMPVGRLLIENPLQPSYKGFVAGFLF